MEPVSTIVLVASMFAGAASTRSSWDVPLIGMPVPAYIAEPLIKTSTAQTVSPTETSSAQVQSGKEILYRQLATYLPGHKAADPTIISKSEDIFVALQFIRMLPSYVTLPTLMRNEDGEIGMYWDDNDVYVDINIDENSTLSLYSRIRSSGAETFIDEVHVDELTAQWAQENIERLIANDNSYALAA